MRFIGVFESSASLWLVTETCAGGDLHGRLTQRHETFFRRLEQQREEGQRSGGAFHASSVPPWGGLSEDAAAACVASLVDALAHLHKQNVAHRDVKVLSLSSWRIGVLPGHVLVTLEGFNSEVPFPHLVLLVHSRSLIRFYSHLIS